MTSHGWWDSLCRKAPRSFPQTNPCFPLASVETIRCRRKYHSKRLFMLRRQGHHCGVFVTLRETKRLMFERGQYVQHIINVHFRMGGVKLETDRFIASRHNRECQPDHQNALVKKSLYDPVSFGSIPYHQRHNRMRPGIDSRPSESIPSRNCRILYSDSFACQSFGAVTNLQRLDGGSAIANP